MSRRRQDIGSVGSPLTTAGLLVVITIFGIQTSAVYRLQIVAVAGIYCIAALGLTLLLGGAGQISIGQGGFMAVGAYASAWASTTWGWPFLLALSASVGLSAVIGIALGFSALRVQGNYLALVTLAFGAITFGLLNEVSTLGGPLGMRGIPPPTLFRWVADSPKSLLFVIWGAAGITAVIVHRLMDSRAGYAIAAVREDEVAGMVLGIDSARYKIRVFALASGIAGLAGVLYAAYLGSIVPAGFNVDLSILLLAIVTIGGLRSVPGTILSSVVLVVLPEFGRDFEDYRLLAYGLAVVLLVVFFPGGLGRLLDWLQDFFASAARFMPWLRDEGVVSKHDAPTNASGR